VLRLTRAAGIRSGEGRLLALVAVLFAALEAGRGLGEVGVDTLVVSRFGAGTLPYLFIGLGATSLVTALAYGAALGRVSRTPLLAGILLGATALLVLGRLIMAAGTSDVVPVIWLVTYASGAIATTISWTVASSVFDARQAKRLFPLCTGAAIAGSFIGTVALLIALIARTGHVRVPARRRDRSMVADVRVGLDEVVRSPLFRLVALAYVLFSVLYFSVTYPFLQAASTTFPTEADLATALGLLSAGVTATSFIVSLAIANRVYARFGIATAALALPLVYVAGFGLWLVQFSFASAAVVRFTQQVTQRGLSNAAWSSFYNVIPAERRAQVLAFIDGVPGQLGMMLSGLLLLGAGRLFAAEHVFWLGLATAIAVTAVVVVIRRRYGASLLRTLRAGLGEQVLEGGPGIAALAGDPQVATALTAALRAPEPTVRRMAIEMLARMGGSGVVDALASSLDDDDPGVRVAALNGLASVAHEEGVAGLIEPNLRDPNESVRAAAVRALGGVADERMDDLVRPLVHDPSLLVHAAVAVALDGREGEPGSLAGLLADPSHNVRHAAIQAIAAVGGLAHGETVAPAMLEALDDDSAVVRRTAAALLSSRDDDTEGVVELLASGSGRAQDAALLALLGHGAAVHERVVGWAEAQITRATARRASRVALQGPTARTATPPTTTAAPRSATLDFLTSVLSHREGRLTDRALGALAVLGAPEAGGVLRRCLRSDDQEVRAQAMEALDSIGDRRLRRAIVRLLDADIGPPVSDPDRTLRELADDDDPWISVLARRAIIEAGGTVQLADTARTLSDIDTMLMLRRVPLFEGLEPEDLQRIATSCIERFFPAGAALVREGEIGAELFVIAEGSVRVVRAEAGGGERLIRRYEAGDHIGELAVLRERPRIASVIAEGDVRALVIEGESLKAILRERPEASMAMLATLAERLSAQ
jgi:HEAT repeat protein/ATP/ADP translocase